MSNDQILSTLMNYGGSTTANAGAASSSIAGAPSVAEANSAIDLFSSSGLYIPENGQAEVGTGFGSSNTEEQSFAEELGLVRLELQSDTPAVSSAIDVVSTSVGSQRADANTESVGGSPVEYDQDGDGVITQEEFARGTAQFLGLYVIPGDIRTQTAKAEGDMKKSTAEFNSKVLNGGRGS